MQGVQFFLYICIIIIIIIEKKFHKYYYTEVFFFCALNFCLRYSQVWTLKKSTLNQVEPQ